MEYASWHWIFLINLPVGLLGCLVAMKLMPDLRSPVPSRFDSIGFLLFGGSMVLISIALEGLGELHLSHLRVVLLLIGGLVLLTAYWLHRACSRRGPSPSASSATCSPAWAAAPCPSSPRCCCRWDWATRPPPRA